MGILISEHKSFLVKRVDVGESFTDIKGKILHLYDDSFKLFTTLESKKFNHQSFSFSVMQEQNHCEIRADYYVGVDWLGDTGRTIYVEPKLNSELSEYFNNCLMSNEDSTETPEIFENKDTKNTYEVNYLSILLKIMALPQTASYSKDVIQIDWNSKYIEIDQKDDRLTPFLIIQFLQHLRIIVRKGLKKSYYKIQENLNSKIKGKVLVSQHIKKNILRNKLSSAFCEFQVFGDDHFENRFLKKVLEFATSYIENNPLLFYSNIDSIKHILNYCRPAFEHISSDVDEHHLKHIKKNPFYNEYAEALRIGQFILKRFSYTITKTTHRKIETPPFWIDMPRLFELYFYYQLLKANPEDTHHIHYQFSTYGNSLDFLISKPGYEMVIDTKYKLKYTKSHIHQDIRQISGYSRLKKVINEMKSKNNDWREDNILDCVIIYPHLHQNMEDQSPESNAILYNFSIENIKNQLYSSVNHITAYHRVFKLGINLPIL